MVDGIRSLGTARVSHEMLAAEVPRMIASPK